MARGFGATFGAGTTDKIVSAYTTVSANPRSYFIRFNRNGLGGGSFGRLWDSQTSVDCVFCGSNGGTTFSFGRGWSTSSANRATWTCPDPGTGIQTSLGIAYDPGSTANDPTMYMDGVSQTVTEVIAPSGTLITTSGAYHIGNLAANTRHWDGVLSEFALWDGVLLDAAEFKALGAGASPLLIRPQFLAEHVPMLRNNISYKLAAPTITGTVVQTHPRILMPRRYGIISVPAAAPSADDVLMQGLHPIGAGLVGLSRGLSGIEQGIA